MKASHLLLLLLLAAGLLYFHYRPGPPEPEPVVEFTPPPAHTPPLPPEVPPAPPLRPGGMLPAVTLKNGHVIRNVLVQRRDPDGFVIQSAQGVLKIYTMAITAEEGEKLARISPKATHQEATPTPNRMSPQDRQMRDFSGKKREN